MLYAIIQRRYVSVVLQVNLHFITLLSVRAEREIVTLTGESNESASGISVLSYQCHKHSTADHIFSVGITLCILTTSKVPYYLQCIHL